MAVGQTIKNRLKAILLLEYLRSLIQVNTQYTDITKAITLYAHALGEGLSRHRKMLNSIDKAVINEVMLVFKDKEFRENFRYSDSEIRYVFLELIVWIDALLENDPVFKKKRLTKQLEVFFEEVDDMVWSLSINQLDKMEIVCDTIKKGINKYFNL